jgi:hypothetical protein
MITDPAIEHLSTGGRQDGPCTVIEMYRDECRVSGEGEAWFVEAPCGFGGWFIFAETKSRDAALILAGECMCESRDRQMRGQDPFVVPSSTR